MLMTISWTDSTISEGVDAYYEICIKDELDTLLYAALPLTQSRTRVITLYIERRLTPRFRALAHLLSLAYSRSAYVDH